MTNEVGWGLVSEHRSGRIFADQLGRVNQAIGAVCDEVVLMVAGRPLRLPAGP
ncbi:MAG: bifunctional adenosylcobinamide kinase/adenosylcobinamide-phosphate guanylyltransferase [Propionicimonas sp.]